MELNNIIYTAAGVLYPIVFLIGAQYGKRAAIGGSDVKGKLTADINVARKLAQKELSDTIKKLKENAKESI